MSPEKWKALWEHGLSHLLFMCEIYKIQADNGRFFLHEHPASASSWRIPEIVALSERSDTEIVVGDMCRFGMTSADMYGTGLVKKPTKFMTNCKFIAQKLALKCNKDHRHVPLMGGRAGPCEVYPQALCEAILAGLRNQLRADCKRNMDGTFNLVCHEEDDCEVMRERLMHVWDEYTDDISGQPLRSDLVAKARQEEMDVFNAFPVYKKVPISTCQYHTGKNPIGVKWVDVNKGDEAEPEYRSRLVAKEIKKSTDEDIFAATPPLEAKKVLFSMAVTGSKKAVNPLKLLFLDVKRAYFYAKVRRPVFVQLPDEDYLEGHCGQLLVSMYGTRDAAQNWEMEYTKGLSEDGFTPGISTPCAFYNPKLDVQCVVHGDDFTFLGTDESLDAVLVAFKNRYDIKMRGRLGPQPKDDKSIRILNRVVTWDEDGIHYEADQRHAEIIVQKLNLADGAATVTTAGVKTKPIDDEELLDPESASLYRRLVARGNYMCIDRQDIQFAIKELSRFMANPTPSAWEALVRLGKYLKLRPRYIIRFGWQPRSTTITTSVDSDWAGEGSTRKSTSGGIMQLGGHVVKSWSSTQNVISLSSGESEFYAIVKGASQSMGLQSLLRDLHLNTRIRVLTDATTGKSIASRRGLGRVRHIDVANLWVQEKIANDVIELSKIKNVYNPSDLLTKHLSQLEVARCMEFLDCYYGTGRSALAPAIPK